MKLIEYNTEWELHHNRMFLWVKKDKVLCSYYLCDFKQSGNTTLNGFWVDPEHRRKGLGKMMMQHMIDLTNDKEEVWLLVSQDNEAAISLYENFGFEVTDGEEEKDGINFIWMVG